MPAASNLMKRVVTPELLDSDAGTPAEVAASLSDLRLINRWFGGAGTTAWMVERIARQRNLSSVSYLEAAAGNGALPEMIRRSLKGRNINVDVTLLDRATSHLRDGNSAVTAVAADALQLPFRDNSFDIIGCNLFGHHLSPEELPQFVDEALRVCRVAVLINDLIRDPLHLALVYAGFPLYRSRLTRHDGPASVRAAYTPGEMRELLKKSRAARVEITRHYLFRMAVIAWKL